MKKLKLNENITVNGVDYFVNGFDTYRLVNIYEQVKEWISYTLISKEDKKKKIWVASGIIKDCFVEQWLIPEEEFKMKTANLALNSEYTGIANITFDGDQGYSLPDSEVIWFNIADKKYDFLIVERFLKKDKNNIMPLKSYYHAARILKDI